MWLVNIVLPWVFVNKVIIENFKSIRHLELDLKPGINLLVGPNAGGKTNILEAIHFLYEALVKEAGKIPYLPHSPRYWSPLDLFYMRDPNNMPSIGLSMECYFGDKTSTTSSKRSKPIKKTRKNLYKMNLTFTVSFQFRSDMNTIIPAAHTIDVSNKTTMMISLDGVTVKIDREFMNKVLAKRLSKEVREKLESTYELEENVYVKRLAWKKDIPRLFAPSILVSLPGILNVVSSDIGIVRIFAPVLTETGREEILFPVYLEKCEKPRGLFFEDVLPIPEMEHAPKEFIGTVIERMLLLRHPDIGSLREPKQFTGETRLNERATNLAPVLLALQGRRGGIPDRILTAFAKLFPGLSIRLNTQFGRVALMAEEDGLELPPSNMPDGAIKLLAILTAIEFSPSLLLIDEIENSMHARMLEYIVDELNSLSVPVIVATHSPIMVDLVGAERTILVCKDKEKGTVIERISDPEKLSEKLEKLGLSLSDYVFYKKTYEM